MALVDLGNSVAPRLITKVNFQSRFNRLHSGRDFPQVWCKSSTRITSHGNVRCRTVPSYECELVDVMIQVGNNAAGIELILRGCKQNVGRIGRRRPVRDKRLLTFHYAVNIHPSDEQKRVVISCISYETL